MKLPHTIYVLASLWFIFLFTTPIVMSFQRPLSPRTVLKRNLEFNPSWEYNRHFNMYKVVITYLYGIKPNDTIQTLYSHYPNEGDVIWAGWFNPEGISFYAPDNQDAIEYMMVEDIKVIEWYTVINDPEEWKKIQNSGYRIANQ